MPKRKNYQCLMLTTPDNRQFFTDEKNYDQLIEFSNTFGADISVVRAKDAQILDLPRLAPAICSPVYEDTSPFEVVEIRISFAQRNRTRKKILKNADKIRQYVRDRFLKGRQVELQQVANHFKKQSLTLACICNHIGTVRKELKKEGYNVAKVGGGKYQLL